jgi:hypothetical protein
LDPSKVLEAKSLAETKTNAIQVRGSFALSRRHVATQTNYAAGLEYVQLYPSQVQSLVYNVLHPYITKSIPPMICEFLF